MTTHYAYMVQVNRLQIGVNLGFYTAERAKPQPVEISFRLYFPEIPPYGIDDHADFLDYAVVCKAVEDFVTAKPFKLIEFMGMEVHRHLRAFLDARGLSHIKVWVQLNKIAAPVPGLTGGASFVHSDLPAGATYVEAPR